MHDFRRYVLIAVVLLPCGVCPAAEEDVLVKSKRVRVLLTSGETHSGQLVELIGSTILLRIKLNERPVKFQAAEITSITCADRRYEYDAEKRLWKAQGDVSTKEKALTPAEKKKKRAGFPATQTVTAEGVGATPEEARKDAIREAVRKVVGVLVVGATTVENEKVLKDEVLTYSDGVIVGGSYKEVVRKREGDIWRIKISAAVVSRKLAEKLVAAGFEVRKIDGEGIAAVVLSRAEARERAAELLQAALEDIPKLVTAEAGKPTDRDYDDSRAELNLTVRIAADSKRYDAAAKRLVEVLDKVCVDSRRATTTGKAGPVEEIPSLAQAAAGPQVLKGEARTHILPVKVMNRAGLFDIALPEDQKGWYMWVMTSRTRDYSSVSWKVYHLDCDHEQAGRPLDGTPTLVVTLLDKGKQVLAKREVDLSHPGLILAKDRFNGWMFHHPKPYEQNTLGGVRLRATHNVGVAPLYLLGKSFSPVQTAKVPVKISEEDLRKLETIRCTVEFRK